MVTTIFINISDAQGQLTPKSVMESFLNSNPSKLLWLVLLSARMKKNHPKMKVQECHNISPIISLWGFFQTQGQLSHKSLVGSCRISNPFEILWLSLLPARIKKNKSKMKELEWSQDSTHYNPMGAICCHGNHSSDPILPKTYAVNPPPK